MSALRWVIRPYLYSQYYFRKFTRTGSFGKNSPDYVTLPYQPCGNAVKDGLFKHHVKQFHDSSCSVASVASVVNTLLEKNGMQGPKPVTQHDLLDTVRAAHWKERMGPGGYKGRRGLPLPTLGRVVRASLDAYDLPYQSLDIVQASRDRNRSGKIRQVLKSQLSRFEAKGDCLLIAHFDQGSYLPELHIPHISPVGGYDPLKDRVEMLDVDMTQPRPYWISFDTFYRGLSYNYNFMFRRFGFAEGGYIFISL